MKFKFHYDKEDDVLTIYSPNSKYSESIEYDENLIIDLDKDGNVIGVEIFDASEFLHAFNDFVNKEFLENLEEAYLEYKEFRNKIFLILVLKSKSGFVKQPMPLIRKVEYKSPFLTA